MADYRTNAAEKIKYYRSVCGINQEELAFSTGISVKQISTLENGGDTMGIDTLAKLCDYFGVTPDDILVHPLPEAGTAKGRKLSAEEVLIRSRVTVRKLYYTLCQTVEDINADEIDEMNKTGE